MRRDFKEAKVENDPNFKVSLTSKHERSACYSKDNLEPLSSLSKPP